MSKHRKIRLEGKRIILRTLTREDAEQIQLAANDSEIGRYTPLPHPFTLEDAYKLIDGSRANINQGKAIFLGVEFVNRVIGMAGLLRIDRSEQSSELGYWVGKDYRNMGLAGESLDTILYFGFVDQGLQRIWGRVTDKNMPSIKMLERRGFTLVKRVPDAREIDGRKTDDLVYSLTKQEYH